MNELTSIYKVIEWSKRDNDDHSGGGFFVVLPEKLGKKYPKKDNDDSLPHITVLYIDDVAKKQKKKGKYIEAIEKVCKETKPFKASLGKRKTLINQDGDTVHYSSIVSSSLKKLNESIKKELDKAGLTYSKRFKEFKPHVTIEYVKEGDAPKYKNKDFKGSWDVSYIWLWGFGEPSIFFLGG